MLSYKFCSLTQSRPNLSFCLLKRCSEFVFKKFWGIIDTCIYRIDRITTTLEDGYNVKLRQYNVFCGKAWGQILDKTIPYKNTINFFAGTRTTLIKSIWNCKSLMKLATSFFCIYRRRTMSKTRCRPWASVLSEQPCLNPGARSSSVR